MQFNRFTAAVLTAGALVLLSINPASAAVDSFSLTVTLRAALHVHPVTARKHQKRVQKFQPRSAIPVISRSMPLLNKLLNSIPIRTTTIWSALIVPNATAATSKA